MSGFGKRLRASRLGFVLIQVIAWIALSQLLRLSLWISFAPDRSATVSDVLRTIITGLHLDIVAAVVQFIPLVIWIGLKQKPWIQSPIARWTLTSACFLGWFLLTFLFLAEVLFFEEFRARFNTVAIDYLIYPHEVFINIWDSYPVPIILAGCAIVAGVIVWLAWKLSPPQVTRPSRRVAIGGWILVALLLALTFRLGELRFSNDRIINELAANGPVSAAIAAFTRNLDYSQHYRVLDSAEAWNVSRKAVSAPGSRFVATNGWLRRMDGDVTRPRHNLIVLLEESLGSEFWGTLGRKEPSLMPHMDRIATEQAWLFDNIYADGNRTIRGLEGILCSFPPLPGDSILARSRSENVASVARVLRHDGYFTEFVYGGRGLFDGLRPFMLNNGYERFVEQKDFPKPAFTTVWGVSNEDLYGRVIADARQLHATGKPFFISSLSVSNHKPYTYPSGRISEDPARRLRAHAVKYTDWALGQFFDSAMKEAFWTNTIVVVIADHGARVYGSQTIPIHSYEIPVLITGPCVVKSPRRISTLGCQLDVAPTLLGIIGRPYDSMFFGRDLLAPIDSPRRVLLHHNRSVGIYRDQRLVVLNLNQKVDYFVGDPKGSPLIRMKTPDDLALEIEKEATALFQISDELYMQREFRFPTW